MLISLLVEDAAAEGAAARAERGAEAGYLRIWLTGAEPEGAIDGVTFVVAVDPASDHALPEFAREIVVSGDSWNDSLRAVLGEGTKGWVRAENIGTIATAARSGVGAVLPVLDGPEAAEEFADEYVHELESPSASAIGGEVNASVAVFIDAGDDPDLLVGLIERYRQAGVDEVVLGGEKAVDAQFIGPVMVEFDDREVLKDAAEKAERLAPVIARMGGTPPDPAPAPKRPPKKPPKEPSERSQAFQEKAVRRMSDRQLEALIGNRVGIRAFFAQLARMYQPAAAADFAGKIEFALGTPHGVETWSLDCSPNGAKANRGEAPDAKLHVEARLADFLRIGTGEISAPSAVLSGKLNVRGDFGLALRLGPMFGGKSIA